MGGGESVPTWPSVCSAVIQCSWQPERAPFWKRASGRVTVSVFIRGSAGATLNRRIYSPAPCPGTLWPLSSQTKGKQDCIYPVCTFLGFRGHSLRHTDQLTPAVLPLLCDWCPYLHMYLYQCCCRFTIELWSWWISCRAHFRACWSDLSVWVAVLSQ